MRLIYRHLFLSLLALIFFCGTDAAAQRPLIGTLSTVEPRALGLGGTLRASAAGTSGVYLNPATIAMVPLYHVGLMYQYTGSEQMHTGSAAIVDSITSLIAAGVSFNYSGINQSRTHHEAFDGRLDLAGGIGDIFFLGVTGRYLHLTQNESSSDWGPGGMPALPASGSQQVDGLTFDVGGALRLGDLVTVGLTGMNLTNTGSVFAPVEIGGGVSITPVSMLMVEADAVIDFTSQEEVSADLHGGAEVFIAERLGLRAGYIYNLYFDIHSITAGVGYVDKQFAVDLGFMHELLESGRMVLAFGFKYFVN